MSNSPIGNAIVPYVRAQSVDEANDIYLENVEEQGKIVAYKHNHNVVSHPAYEDLRKSVNEDERSGHVKVRLSNTGELLYFHSLVKTIDFLS